MFAYVLREGETGPPADIRKGKDQYRLFWNHEQALVNDKGVVYLSPPQKALKLID